MLPWGYLPSKSLLLARSARRTVVPIANSNLSVTNDSTFTPQLVPSQPITTDDLEREAVFSQRVRLFGWIREQHLDVPEGEASQGFLGFAEQGRWRSAAISLASHFK